MIQSSKRLINANEEQEYSSDDLQADNEENELKEIKKNEEGELRGDQKIQSAKNFLFPHFGPFFTFYNFFYAFHKGIVAFYLPF